MARASYPVSVIQSLSSEPPLITVRLPLASRMTGLSRTRLYALIKIGEIEIIKVGGNTLIIVESLQAFVDRERAKRVAAKHDLAGRNAS